MALRPELAQVLRGQVLVRQRALGQQQVRELELELRQEQPPPEQRHRRH